MKVLVVSFFIFSSFICYGQELKLEDLGFKKNDLKVNVKDDKIFKKRSSMLSTHQTLGLAALALMTATYLTGEEGGIEPGEGKTTLGATDTHKFLGIASGLMYFTAAGFSLLSPDSKNEKESRGSTKWHKRLAYIHFPAMLLTMALGLISDHQYKTKGKVSGLVAQKPLIANIAYFSLLAAGVTMTFDF